jgi:3-deoxy-D-manno-octulosonic-acid transferase
METELWPNLCASAKAEGVELALVNARLSERSLRRGQRHAALIVPALESLRVVVAQTHADARRLRELGRHEVVVAGNMKFDIQPPADILERGRRWRALLGGRPVVLAASTRDGEEAPLLAAWRERPEAPGVLLVIVPRHPQRFDAVARLIETQGFVLSRRSDSAGQQPDGQGSLDWLRTDVLLGDSMGEMFAWYAMADVAVLGGSLLPFGGQNLIEACASSCPVVLGPHTFNFEDAAEQAVAAQAALRVADAGEAVRKALELIAQAGALPEMGMRGARFAAEHRGATRRTLASLQERELLPQRRS